MIMMHIRRMRVAVTDRLMPVRVSVRLSGRRPFGMRMLMMLIMHVRMRVLHRLMLMLVFVLFAKM